MQACTQLKPVQGRSPQAHLNASGLETSDARKWRNKMITASEMKTPRLVTALPGPKAKQIVERDAKFMSPSFTRDYPLVAKSEHGAMSDDVDGNVFLDFAAGKGGGAAWDWCPDRVGGGP